jgi:hypothetical protein
MYELENYISKALKIILGKGIPTFILELKKFDSDFFWKKLKLTRNNSKR